MHGKQNVKKYRLYKMKLSCAGFKLKLQTYSIWQYLKITVYKRKYKIILLLKFAKYGGMSKSWYIKNDCIQKLALLMAFGSHNAEKLNNSWVCFLVGPGDDRLGGNMSP